MGSTPVTAMQYRYIIMALGNLQYKEQCMWNLQISTYIVKVVALFVQTCRQKKL